MKSQLYRIAFGADAAGYIDQDGYICFWNYNKGYIPLPTALASQPFASITASRENNIFYILTKVGQTIKLELFDKHKDTRYTTVPRNNQTISIEQLGKYLCSFIGLSDGSSIVTTDSPAHRPFIDYINKKHVIAISAKENNIVALTNDAIYLYAPANSYSTCNPYKSIAISRDCFSHGKIKQLSTTRNYTAILFETGEIVKISPNNLIEGIRYPVYDTTPLTSISAGKEHVIGLHKNGNIIAWGDNSYQQHSIPDIQKDDIQYIHTEDNHNFAILKNQKISNWGHTKATPIPPFLAALNKPFLYQGSFGGII